MVKNQHTLYIDDEKFDECRKRGINLSLTLSKAIDRLMSDESFDYTLHLDYLSSMIKAEEDKLVELDSERKETDKKLKTLKAEYKRIAKNFRLEEESIALSKLLASLNKVILSSDYNVVATELAADDILKQIYKLRSDFDLKRHVELIKETVSL